MPAYKHLDVTEVGDVTVVRFRSRRITEDIDIQDSAARCSAWWRTTNAGNCS